MKNITNNIIYLIEIKNDSPLTKYFNNRNEIKIKNIANICDITINTKILFDNEIKKEPQLKAELPYIKGILDSFKSDKIDLKDLLGLVEKIDEIETKVQSEHSLTIIKEIYTNILVKFDINIDLQFYDGFEYTINWKNNNKGDFGVKLGIFVNTLYTIIFNSPNYIKFLEIISTDSNVDQLILINIEENNEINDIGLIDFKKITQGTLTLSNDESIYSFTEFILVKEIVNEIITYIEGSSPHKLNKTQIYNIKNCFKTSNYNDFRFKLYNIIANGYFPNFLSFKLLKWFDIESQEIVNERYNILYEMFNLLSPRRNTKE